MKRLMQALAVMLVAVTFSCFFQSFIYSNHRFTFPGFINPKSKKAQQSYEQSVSKQLDLIEKRERRTLKDSWSRWTALHQAIRFKDLEAIETLLTQEILIDAQDHDGRTSLHHAALLGFAEGVKLLLHAGAKPYLKDKNGDLPIHLAVGKDRGSWQPQADYCAVVELLALDARLCNPQDKKGRTPLHYAAIYGHADIVEKLLQKGADIRRRDRRQATPLHYAAGRIKVTWAEKEDYFKVVQHLINAGASVSPVDKGQRTPLHYAAAHGNEQVVKFLLEKGALINCCDREGSTPLHYAFGKDSQRFMPLKYAEHVKSVVQIHEHSKSYHRNERDHAQVATLLMNKGAHDYIKDHFGKDPLFYARKNKHEALIKFYQKIEKVN